MGYSENPAMVRVDFFKASGKWYCTEAVKWTGDYHFANNKQLLVDSFKQSLRDHLIVNGKARLSDMLAVCLEPYYEHSCPIMMEVSRIVE